MNKDTTIKQVKNLIRVYGHLMNVGGELKDSSKALEQIHEDITVVIEIINEKLDKLSQKV
jgi:uncharacterized protein YaaR (DUF327 family)